MRDYDATLAFTSDISKYENLIDATYDILKNFDTLTHSPNSHHYQVTYYFARRKLFVQTSDEYSRFLN